MCVLLGRELQAANLGESQLGLAKPTEHGAARTGRASLFECPKRTGMVFHTDQENARGIDANACRAGA